MPVDDNIIPDIFQVNHHICDPVPEVPEYKHILTACNLVYVIEGEVSCTVNNANIDLAAGNLLVLPQDYVCERLVFSDSSTHCFLVDFNLKNANNQIVQPPFPLVSKPGRHEDIVHVFHELAFAWLNKQPGYVMKSRGLFLLILCRFLELTMYKTDSNVGDSRIDKVIRYMTAHFSEHITAQTLADITGLNPTYFGVLFKQLMGISFNRYLIQVRVKNAENMLSSGEYTVKNVAAACGFTDVSHFYKQFKTVKGYPPSHSMPKKFNL